jgi:hypothetical protein
MTHDILQSDITLATRLIGDQCPNEEVILALVHRGVDPAQAAKLLDDLRSGKKPTAQSPLPPEMGMSRRSRSRNAARGTSQGSPTRSPDPGSRRQRSSPPATRGRKKPAVVWMVAVVVFVLAIGVAGIALFQHYHAGANSQEDQRPKAASSMPAGARQPAQATVAAATHVGLMTPLVLELLPDGLRIGGSLVTHGNLLPAIANLLGVPTRTNQVAQTGTVIYAYDQHGLLIYSQPRGGTNSIVLDCEASGGVNGTTSAFAGKLKVEDQVVGPDTDPQTLAGIKKLSLGNPRSGGTIWAGRYNNFEVVFAYLKSSRHLSLIEIDLK